jgi:hypothetical protein
MIIWCKVLEGKIILKKKKNQKKNRLRDFEGQKKGGV